MHDGKRVMRLAVVAAVLVLACLASGSAPAQEAHGMHGQAHDGLHYWYRTLKQPNTGISCCNDTDCRPTVSRVVNGIVQVELDGEWTNVPPEKILRTPSPDLGAHVCAPRHSQGRGKGFMFCVVLGSGV